MRTIRVKRQATQNREDCRRIQNVLMDMGYYASIEQCDELWRLHSENDAAANWLNTEGFRDEEIYKAIRPYFDESPEPKYTSPYL